MGKNGYGEWRTGNRIRGDVMGRVGRGGVWENGRTVRSKRGLFCGGRGLALRVIDASMKVSKCACTTFGLDANKSLGSVEAVVGLSIGASARCCLHQPTKQAGNQ